MNEKTNPPANENDGASADSAPPRENESHAQKIRKTRGPARKTRAVDITETGGTELHRAIAEKNFPLFNALVVRDGIDLNARDNNGNTPMHLALESPVTKFVEDLAERDVRLDIENNDHKTAMQLASDRVEAKDATKHDIKKLALVVESFQRQGRAANSAQPTVKGGNER